MQDELDLLLVDEFQDASPIPLALFLKLAGLAKEAVFVGDIKQAIYGFRGSDPVLMQAVLKEVESRQGGRTDILERSWRSRPALVAYTNRLFVHAFFQHHARGPGRADAPPQRKEVHTRARRRKYWALRGGRLELSKRRVPSPGPVSGNWSVPATRWSRKASAKPRAASRSRTSRCWPRGPTRPRPPAWPVRWPAIRHPGADGTPRAD